TIDAKVIKDNEGGTVSASYFIKRAAGGTSYSNPQDFRVGRAVEDLKPVISTVKDSKGEDIPHNGGTVDPKIKLTGTAAPLQEVEVFDNGASKGKYTANDAGIWTCETTLTGIGTRTLTAKALYGTGQVSLGKIFTLSNAIKPTIISVKDSKDVDIPDKGTTLDTTVKLTGGGTPRLKVEIFDGTTPKGIAEVGASNGRWELEVTGLSLTEHSFTAKALYAPGESSVARTLTVGLFTPIKPSIKEAAGSSNLNPIAAKERLTVVVPQYTGMDSNDQLTVTWTGAANTLPGGSHTSTAFPVGTVGQKEIEIPNTVVAFNLGKSVKVFYTVTRNGVPTKSAEFDLNVQVIPNGHAELTKPTIDGATGDVLDVKALPAGGSTRIARWPLIAVEQTLWLRFSGTKADGSAYTSAPYVATPLTTEGLPTGVRPYTPDLRGLKDSSTLRVEFKVGFDRSTDEAKAVSFQLRNYTVNTLPKLIVDTSPLTLSGTNIKFLGVSPPWSIKGTPPGTSETREASGGVRPYTYVSSNPQIATVHPTEGIITSVDNGSTTITVTDTAGQTEKIEVETANVVHVYYNPISLTLGKYEEWFKEVGGRELTNGQWRSIETAIDAKYMHSGSPPQKYFITWLSTRQVNPDYIAGLEWFPQDRKFVISPYGSITLLSFPGLAVMNEPN
ncbi:Ig-like domain-containing protein, partial [Pseudomonas sp. MPR-ANC1]|uniref:Ig-like domain-containing protein n=1 Tax=Pseudomonas sp. MPR-ANC1 TaxID=2075548 RepID=UPI0015AA70E6